MSAAQWRIMSGLVMSVGALSWLVKLVVIVATRGETVDTGAAAVFYLLGLVLLAAGGALLGIWATAGRGLILRFAGGVSGVLAFFISFVILDALARVAVGQRGPDYAASESGVFLTAVIWLAIGLWVWTRATQTPEHTASQG